MAENSTNLQKTQQRKIGAYVNNDGQDPQSCALKSDQDLRCWLTESLDNL